MISPKSQCVVLFLQQHMASYSLIAAPGQLLVCYHLCACILVVLLERNM